MKRSRTGVAFLIGAAALVLALAGCEGPLANLTEGYGAVTLQIQGTLMGTGGPSAAVVGRAAGDPLVIPVADVAGASIGTLTLTDARINLGEIELEQDDAEIDTDEETDQENEIEFDGPFVVDFIQDTVTPALPMIEMLPGTYDNIKLKLDTVESEDLATLGLDETDLLYGRSIYLAGSYTGETAGGQVTDAPFSLAFDFDEEFELSAGTATDIGLLVENGQLNPVIIAFRMAQWFAFDSPETNSDLLIDFTDLVVAAGPAIVLDETSIDDNETIREIIKDNIEESADYGEDEDGSGELESDEDDDPDEEDADDYLDEDEDEEEEEEEDDV